MAAVLPQVEKKSKLEENRIARLNKIVKDLQEKLQNGSYSTKDNLKAFETLKSHLPDFQKYLYEIDLNLLDEIDFSKKFDYYLPELLETDSIAHNLLVLKDGRIAMGSSLEPNVSLLDPNTYQITILDTGTDCPLFLAELPDGRLITGSNDSSSWRDKISQQMEVSLFNFCVLSTISIWDLKNNKLANKFHLADSLTSCSIKAIAVVSENQVATAHALCNEITIWNVNNGDCVAVLKGHTEGVESLVMLRNGLLASGSADKSIRIWNLDSQKCIKVLEGHQHTVMRLITLPNQKLVSGSRDKTIRIWKLDNYSCKGTLNASDEITALIDLGNNVIASASVNSIQTWDIEKNSNLTTLQNGDEYEIRSLAALGENQFLSGGHHRDVSIWIKNQIVLVSFFYFLVKKLADNYSVKRLLFKDISLDFLGNEDIQALQWLLEQRPDLSVDTPLWTFQLKTRNLEQALRRAAATSDPAMLQILIRDKVNIDEPDKEKRGYTALHWALDSKRLDNAKFLIENKARYDIPDKEGNTVIDLAIKLKDKEFLEILFFGYSLSKKER